MPASSLSFLEYNALLALLEGPQHGYALLRVIEEQSMGRLNPRTGSLYRVLARLMGWGLVEEAEKPQETDPHPGLDRRYYRLTPEGVEAVRAEARLLRAAAEVAERRLGLDRQGD